MTTGAPVNEWPPSETVAVSLVATVRPTGEIERLSIEGRSLTSGRALFAIRPKIEGVVDSLQDLLVASDLWIFVLEDSITAP